MNNRCFCCEQTLAGTSRYHTKCLKILFGSTREPHIRFGVADMPAQIINLGAKMSISGVQIKASVKLNPDRWELEIVSTGGTYILKPEPNEYPELPQNENLCMNIAQKMGLMVPPHGLLPMADQRLCYIVKRFDRLDDGTKLQKETMCQILQSTEKYKGSMESIGKAIRSHATNTGLDSIDFFERILLCFLLGNGDMHLKNWSLLINQNKTITMAPCYDLICSKIYLPVETESALTINGKTNKLSRSDFEALGEYLLIEHKAVQNVFKKYGAAKDTILEMCNNSQLNPNLKHKLADVVKSRYKCLEGLARNN